MAVRHADVFKQIHDTVCIHIEVCERGMNNKCGSRGIFHGLFYNASAFFSGSHVVPLCFGNVSVAAVPSFPLAHAPALQLCILRPAFLKTNPLAAYSTGKLLQNSNVIRCIYKFR